MESYDRLPFSSRPGTRFAYVRSISMRLSSLRCTAQRYTALRCPDSLLCAPFQCTYLYCAAMQCTPPQRASARLNAPACASMRFYALLLFWSKRVNSFHRASTLFEAPHGASTMQSFRADVADEKTNCSPSCLRIHSRKL